MHRSDRGPMGLQQALTVGPLVLVAATTIFGLGAAVATRYVAGRDTIQAAPVPWGSAAEGLAPYGGVAVRGQGGACTLVWEGGKPPFAVTRSAAADMADPATASGGGTCRSLALVPPPGDSCCGVEDAEGRTLAVPVHVTVELP